MTKRYFCIDCGAETKGYSDRCKSCALSCAKRKYWEGLISERRIDLYRDRDWLYENYVEKGLTLWQLAEVARCSIATIYSWMDWFEIPRRPHSEVNKRSGRGRFPDIKWELLDDPEWLRRMYWENDLSLTGLAEMISCGWVTMRGYFRLYEIPLRSRSEATKISRQRPEWRRAQSEGLRAAHARGAYDGVYKSPSQLELKVAETLDTLDIPYEQQFRPNGMSRPFDFFLTGTDVLIEVQGVYWHSGEEMKAWDLKKAQGANERGYRVLEIWEDTIWDLGVEEAVRVTLTRGGNDGW